MESGETSHQPVLNAVQTLLEVTQVSRQMLGEVMETMSVSAAEAAADAHEEKLRKQLQEEAAAKATAELVTAVAGMPAAVGAAVSAAMAPLLQQVQSLMGTGNGVSDSDHNIYGREMVGGGTPFSPVSHHHAPEQSLSRGLNPLSKWPLPDKFDGKTNVHDAIFLIERYLEGIEVPRDKWHLFATNLLTGKALEHWVTFAKPRAEQHIPTSWTDMVQVLTTMFGKLNTQFNARRELLSVKQSGTVQQYIGHIRSLIAKSGPPSLSERDLIILFLTGLKPDILHLCHTDHSTGQEWQSFTALVDYAIRMDSPVSSSLLPPNGQRKQVKFDQSPAKHRWGGKLTKTTFTKSSQGGHGRGGWAPGGRGGSGGRGGGSGGGGDSRGHKRGRSHSRDSSGGGSQGEPRGRPPSGQLVAAAASDIERCHNCRSKGHRHAACPYPRGGPFPWDKKE